MSPILSRGRQRDSLPHLSEDQLSELSEGELRMYMHQLVYEQALQSPLDLACWVSPETERTPHLEYINDRIVALFDYRLYHKAGPGPVAKWYYRPAPGVRKIQIPTPYDIPWDTGVYEYWGEHPDDPKDRVVFQLGIACPPRHGKSWIVTEHLPLWLWLWWPDMDIGFCTYSDDFASKWGRKLRARIAESHDKLGLTLENGERHDTQHLYFNETKGNMFLVGTGGALTGRGYQAGIVDDPLKDAAEAMSTAVRNAKSDWYESTFSSRGTPVSWFPIPVIIMMFTRWHQDDLAGRFIYDEKKNVRKTWHMIRLPAIALEDDPLGRAPGTALWPKVITAQALLDRQTRDPLWFGAMYQGWPTMGDKGLFSRWHVYSSSGGMYSWREDQEERRIVADECIRFATMDTAYTKSTWSDYTVFAVWDFHRTTGRGFLVHVERVKLEAPMIKESLQMWWRKWSPSFVGIEDTANGKQLIQELRSQSEVVIRPLQPDGDKVSRALGYAQAAANGIYLLPESGPWITEYREEHSLFPDSAKHDDQVDTGSYAHWVMQRLPRSDAAEARNARYIVDTSPEGRVKRHMEKLDRKVRVKSKSARSRALSGRLGR